MTEREQWWEGKIMKRKSNPFLHQSHDNAKFGMVLLDIQDLLELLFDE